MTTFKGVWDPYDVYVGPLMANEDTPDPNDTIPRPEGADIVLWQGARWICNYYHTGVNPMSDIPGETGRWQLFGGDTPNYNPAPPEAPTGLKAGFVSDDVVTLFWDAAYVPGVGEVTHYNVYQDGVRVGVTATTSFAIDGLDASDLSTFSVEAVNGLPQDGFGTSPRANLGVTTEAAATDSGKYYSPFIDMTLPTTNIVDLARDSGLQDLTLAFMQTNNDDLDVNGNLIAGRVPTLAWGGLTNTTLPTGAIIEQVQQLQALGGEITIAFGGYNGREAAFICAQYSEHLQAGGMSKPAADANAAAHLQTMYQSVIDTYNVKHLDFDIENAVYKLNEAKKAAIVDDFEANHLRNLAINGLRADNPDLHISFTVATLPEGVNDDPNTVDGNGFILTGGSGDVLAMLQQLVADGVQIDVVNIMAMDYFDGPANNADMGDAAIEAARAMYATLRAIGLDAKVGITPMLGQNDARDGVDDPGNPNDNNPPGNEVFTLDDARDLVEFMRSTPWVAGLGAWQLTRDRENDTDMTGGADPFANGQVEVSPYNTGLVQSDFEFSRILEQISLWTPTGGRGDDTITGTAGANTLTGDAGNDVLDGGSGNDTLNGGLGTDRLKGGDGKDTLDGGAGVADVADYLDKTAGVSVTLMGALDAVVRVGGVIEDTIRNVEHLYGGSGADGLGGNVAANHLYGGLGDDVLKGGGGNDILVGGGGFDAVDYRDKATAVTLTLNGASSAIASIAGGERDTVREVEAIYGGSAGDTLAGDGAANLFRGGGGADVINGAGGLDVIDFRDKTASVVLTLNGSTNAQATVGGVAEDTVRNVEGVMGGSAADTLTGDGFANALTGGGGADMLRGGGGADTFVYTFLTQSTVALAGRDTIADFNHAQGDRIDLSAIDAISGTGGDQAFVFGAMGTAGSIALSTVVAGSAYLVQVDVNGGGADFAILVNSGTALGANDFVL